MGRLHQTAHIRPHTFANLNILFTDLIDFLAVRPDLIGRTRHALCTARGAELRLIRHTVSMQTHYRAEGSIFKPAHQHLMELLIVNIGAKETADVSGPPGNPGDAHIQAGRKLILQAVERRVDITRPDKRTVFLAAGPCTPQKIYDVFLALCPHPLEKGLRIHHRVHIADLHIRPQMITVILKIIHTVFRLRLIQPEDFHALVIIVLLRLAPDILSGLRIGRIILNGIPHIDIVDPHTLFHPGEQALRLHLLEILTLIIHHRPDGNHQLDAHLLQLCDHGIRIRPVGLVKTPVTLLRPVEEIHHDHIHRNTSSLVFPRHLQQFFLCLITQLTLPEPHAVFRHHRHLTRSIRIGFLNLRRRIARRDPVIQFLRRLHFPCGNVLVEAHTPDCRVIPQETISQRRQRKRHAGLRISMCQFQFRTFHIQELLLVLPHTVELLLRIGLKPHGQLIVTADDGLEFSRLHLQRTARIGKHVLAITHIFFQQHLILLIIKGELPDIIDHRPDLSVHDLCRIFPDRHLCLVLLRFSVKRPQLLRHLWHLGCTHAQAVVTPRFHDHPFRIIPIIQCTVLLLKVPQQELVVRAKIPCVFLALSLYKISHLFSSILRLLPPYQPPVITIIFTFQNNFPIFLDIFY